MNSRSRQFTCFGGRLGRGDPSPVCSADRPASRRWLAGGRGRAVPGRRSRLWTAPACCRFVGGAPSANSGPSAACCVRRGLRKGCCLLHPPHPQQAAEGPEFAEGAGSTKRQQAAAVQGLASVSDRTRFFPRRRKELALRGAVAGAGTAAAPWGRRRQAIPEIPEFGPLARAVRLRTSVEHVPRNALNCAKRYISSRNSPRSFRQSFPKVGRPPCFHFATDSRNSRNSVRRSPPASVEHTSMNSPARAKRYNSSRNSPAFIPTIIPESRSVSLFPRCNPFP
jgi:hypothetical protein